MAGSSKGSSKRIGDYQYNIQSDLVGKGGFGVVFKGQSLRSFQSVAIKKVKRKKSENRREIDAIQREISVLKLLRHDNIVNYIDHMKTTNHHYIIMEYIENGSLSDSIKKYGPMPENQAAYYVYQLLTGLAFLHSQGVIHCDIKGANVLLTSTGLVKLADFGLATKLADVKEGEVKGTPYWMAPEIASGEGPISESVDIWSVGCTVIELITGTPPYFDLNQHSALYHMVNDDHPPFPKNGSSLLESFLIACFQKTPSLRTSSKSLLEHAWLKKHTRDKKPQQRKAPSVRPLAEGDNDTSNSLAPSSMNTSSSSSLASSPASNKRPNENEQSTKQNKNNKAQDDADQFAQFKENTEDENYDDIFPSFSSGSLTGGSSNNDNDNNDNNSNLNLFLQTTDSSLCDNTPYKLNNDDVQLLNQLLNCHNFGIRKSVSEYINQHKNELKISSKLSVNELRDKEDQCFIQLLEQGFINGASILGDPLKMFAYLETLSNLPDAFPPKLSIHYGLYGGTVMFLGTEYHHQQFLSNFESADKIGCFCMTELGHGTNVKEIQTTATYDINTKEFIINTPSESAQKYYIGNLGRTAKYASVFAQLIINEQNYGVHAFVVPVRDTSGNLSPNIRIRDCGMKLGLNGIDNTRVWFDHLRIPRENLLNRYANVSEDGTYSTDIKSPSKRFATHISALLLARISVGCATCSSARLSLTVALRYSLRRRQFGPNQGTQEVPIIWYSTHQRRLIPHLAANYAWSFFHNYVKLRYAYRSPEESKQIHLLASLNKAMSAWHSINTSQACREACGGQGYMMRNLIAKVRANIDVMATLDGDNYMLLQQSARVLLSEYSASLSSQKSNVSRALLLLRHAVDDATMHGLKFRMSLNNADSVCTLDYISRALEHRQLRMLHTLGRRLQAAMNRNNGDAFVAWNEVQTHAVELARVHAEHAAFQAFYSVYRHVVEHTATQSKLQTPSDDQYKPEPFDIDALMVASVPEQLINENVQRALQRLLMLFGLSCMEQDSWFTANNVLNNQQFKSVRREIDNICKELVPNMDKLTDSLGCLDCVLEDTIGSQSRCVDEINAYDYQQTE
eukprot:gb/GECH01006808.1/.p1 GENE.gb/GECH01006808.1/~~gb/GECH01006808.1/.p1  ORF type:complete len:1078 (+),score=269.99 gb/GECH01006808.1/:1-3234(+)